jgi:hypothetical protein
MGKFNLPLSKIWLQASIFTELMRNRITWGCIIPNFTQNGQEIWTVGVEIHYGQKQNFAVTKPVFMKHMPAEYLIYETSIPNFKKM